MRKAALSLITSVAIMMIAISTAQAEIAWQTNLRTAHAQAQADSKLLLLHFYTDNCTWCDRLEAGSFKAPQVGEALSKDFVAVKIHAAKNPKLTEMFKVSKFPTDVIVTTQGKMLSHQVSPQKPDQYVAMLTKSLPQAGAPQVAAAAAAKPEAEVATAPVASSQGGVPGYAQKPASEVALQAGIEAPGAGGKQSLAYINSPTPPGSAPQAPVAPTAPEAPAPASAGLTLPSMGTQGQLASTQSMSLEMPTQGVTPSVANHQPSTNSQATDSASTFTTPPLPAAQPSLSQTVSVPEAQPTAEPAAPSVPTSVSEQPELAMDGFCAVTVIKEDRWAEGSPQYGVIHLGKLYLFVSEEAMQTFLADPVPYTPVLNEIDVVRFFEERKIVPGKREFGVKDPIYNRMFFFADEEARNHFENTYERYTDAAIQVMERAVKDANPGT